MRTISVCFRLAFAAAGTLLLAPAAQATLLGPSAYTGFVDSPFYGGSFGSFYLEDFEDGVLNTPDVTASGGIVLTFGTLRDSVESTPNGYSYYTNGVTSLTFTFSGTLPTHAGLVWTDVGCLLSEGNSCPPIQLGGGVGDVYFEAFDDNLVSLGQIFADDLGDGAADGGTAEDRFFGATNATGISSLVIWMPNSNDWELDHLQYGIASEVIPEPGTASLLGLALAGLAVLRRSRR